MRDIVSPHLPAAERTVFFVSDGTGITAETFGNAILAQFEAPVRRFRLPFIDSVDKAHQAVRQINHTATVEGKRPLVFTTVVNMDNHSGRYSHRLAGALGSAIDEPTGFLSQLK